MTASFDVRPSGTLLASRAWSSFFQAFAAMKPLFLSAILIGIAWGSAELYIPYFQSAVFHHQINLSASFLINHWTVEAISILVWNVIAAPVAVAIHRFILLGQATEGFISIAPSHTRKFFLWAVALQLLNTIIGNLEEFFPTSPPYLSIGIDLVLVIAFLFVSVHLAMIFPATAIDTPSEGWRFRIRKSWSQMRGKSWLFVRAAILASLPLVALHLTFWIFFGGPHASLHGGNLQNSMQPVLLGFSRFVGIALAAAVASWLYVWVRESEPI